MRPLFILLLSALLSFVAAAEPLRIGSKRFTEAYILAEILAQTARPHAAVEVKSGLGNTAIVYQALTSGAIDVYPEYTGTIALEILKDPQADHAATPCAKRWRRWAWAWTCRWASTTATRWRCAPTSRPGWASAASATWPRHPALRLALSNEFIGRADGWPGLTARYGLPQQPRGLDHGLAYDALTGGQVDVIDIYTTDAQIGHRSLRVLVDDRQHFPRYDAVLLYRLDVPQRHPEAWRALQGLAGRIDEATMIRLNARAEIDKQGFADIARDHLAGKQTSAVQGGFVSRLFGPDLLRLSLQHLGLVAAAVLLATLIGVPLALLVGRPWRRARAAAGQQRRAADGAGAGPAGRG